jgi:UTP--glucose-1-phosphate uridylyltransferase
LDFLFMDTQPIETAVIPVAGIGSRMLPATWSIEKCMLPIYSGGKTRLLVDWMVEECVDAGIKRVIFVTTERGKKQLYDYFEKIDDDLELRYDYLGKGDVVATEQARRDSYGITYEYVIQPPDGYGTTVPPFLARHLLEGERRFFLMGGDDFVYHEDPQASEISLAIKTWNDAGTDHIIMGNPLPRERAPRYGIFFTDDQGNLSQWVEKPALEDVPNIPIVTSNISRYGFSDRIWDFIDEEMNAKRDGEHLITYPVLNALAAGQMFRIHPVRGQYLDGGTIDGIVAAGKYITEHPQHKVR